jgi:AraC-like DNA-binding protein
MRHGQLVFKDIIRPFAAQLRAQGVDPVPIARRCGILGPAEVRAPALVPADAVHRFCDLGASESGDPDLGLHAASRQARGAAGVVEFGVRFARTLGEAVQFLARHHSLLRAVSTLRVEDPAHGPRLALVPPDGLRPSWPVDEYEMAVLVRILREAAGEDWRPHAITFAHPRPASTDELSGALGARCIRFGASRSSLQIAPHDLARENAGADAALFGFLAAQADRALDALGVELVPGFIRERLAEQIDVAAPRLTALSRSLHMSPRTLQRRLETSGTTYQRLVDAVRCKVATRRLEETDVSTSALAAQLGYSTPRAFLRAFQRWTGLTPAQWRRRGDVFGRSAGSSPGAPSQLAGAPSRAL